MPEPAIVLKPIPPPHLDVDEIRLEMLNALRKEAGEIRKALDKTTSTWSGAKPKFKDQSISLAGGNASVATTPTGDEKGVQKWVWLNEGTSIRWALMSPSWSSKTRPGRLHSGPGRGRVIIAGRRAMTARNIKPRPGIEARKWDEALAKQRKRPFGKAMASAIKKGSEKAGLR